MVVTRRRDDTQPAKATAIRLNGNQYVKYASSMNLLSLRTQFAGLMENNGSGGVLG